MLNITPLLKTKSHSSGSTKEPSFTDIAFEAQRTNFHSITIFPYIKTSLCMSWPKNFNLEGKVYVVETTTAFYTYACMEFTLYRENNKKIVQKN